MNNNYLLSLASSVVPILAIGFVGIVLLYKFYIKIRSKFDTTVNCWFCNQNARVPYLQANSWNCPKCEQYNGFIKDGNYNREIIQQRDCSNLSGTGAAKASTVGGTHSSRSYTGSVTAPLTPPRNGFCDSCNEAQRLKVEKLAQFEPKNESHFDQEIKVYKAQLEEQYRLCSTCNRHLNKVLREKKKMVLGSKFLDFIIRGAEALKQPHFNQIRYVRQQHWKQRCSLWITIFTIFNIICLFSCIPALNRDAFTKMLGETLGTQLFIICSHLLALSKVISSYFQGISTHPTALKAALFFRTLFMMILYSMGLKWPQVVSFQFSSLYVLACPFVLLCCAFAYNVVDGFKLTRYTFLLAVWSAFAGGLVEDKLILPKDLVLLLASFTTLFLSASTKNSTRTTKFNDDTASSSFHKIYSEDYLSDEDTLSMISQHFNSSSASECSMRSNSYGRLSSSPQCRPAAAVATSAACKSRLARSPIASSVPASLNNLTSTPSRMQFSPNASFRTCIGNEYNRSSLHSPYAGSVNSFAMAGNASRLGRSTHFTSNFDFMNNSRPQSAFGYDASVNGLNSSFLEKPSHTLRRRPQETDESFFTTNGDDGQQLNGTLFPGTPPHNPLPYPNPAITSSATYQQQRANNLLTPSRFSTNCMANNASASTSWLSGGYFNQRNPLNSTITQADSEKNRNLFGHRNGIATTAENLSRASSQSSGFESQNSRPTNISRENSLGPDANDLLQRTSITDQVGGVTFSGSFQPIEPSYGNVTSFSPRPASLQSQSTLMRPLSVNCSINQRGSSWLGSPAACGARGIGFMGDSFNLRKITEDLPTIKRGDLLRKWKEGQAILQ